MHLNDIPISIPAKHEKISAKWAGDITRTMNARRLIAGKGIKLKKSPNGIVIESTATGTGKASVFYELNPFMCRYVTIDTTGSYDGWEIYLPPGCVSISQTHEPLNPKATRKIKAENGEQKTIEVEDWYRLEIPSQEVNYQDGTVHWNVVVESKGCAAIDGVTSFGSMPMQYIWARAYDPHNIDEAWNTKDVGGTTFSNVVGSIMITEEDGSEDKARTYFHDVKYPIFVMDTSSQTMKLIHSFSVNSEDVQLDTAKLYLSNQAFTAAGATYISDNLTEIDDNATSIYLEVDASTSPYLGRIHAFTNSQNNETEELKTEDSISQLMKPDNIFILLFRLENHKVVLDNRAALNNIQLYK